jgi:GntR family transcriptional repressor for pyruvate dehydrogenase complex
VNIDGRPPAGTANGLRPPKAAILVAQRIVNDAVRGQLSPGDLLPPERIMLQEYGTGRGTLREAIRLLEYQGILSLKPGPGGGPVLMDPAASNLANTLMLLLHVKHAPYRVIVEFRSALEPVISQLAAERISDEDLASLAETIEAMRSNLKDEETFLEANKRFHDIIAWSSGNVLFGYIMDSLLEILDGRALGINYPSHRRDAILKAHSDIYESLLARDAAGSESRMREHIAAYTRYTERKYPEVLSRTITWDPS